MLIAAGPYSAVDDLEYQPLVELLDIIERDTPDVCILVRSHLKLLKCSAT